MPSAAPCHTDGMTEAAYRIVAEGSWFKVEINRPGRPIQIAAGFETEADARWIEEDKRITGIDGRQKPMTPPHLR